MPRPQGALAAIGAVVLALLLVWGASGGDAMLSAPRERAEADAGLTDGDTETEGLPTPTEDRVEAAAGEGVDGWLVLQLVLIAGLLWAVWRWLRCRPHEVEEEMEAAARVDELSALVEATSMPPLETSWGTGDPRNDIVACWVALEDGVARSGLTPEPSETSADLARRVLHRWQVDEHAVDTLAALYREARFSRHPLTQAQRQDAVAALTLVHGSLARARTGPLGTAERP